jgi:hypothetical protein
LKKKDSASFGSFLKEAWALYKERVLTRRALRLLNKQEWSVEFLTAMLYKAAKAYGQSLEMTITGPGGVNMTIRTADKENPTRFKDESILERLDDELAVQQFISQVQGGSK